MSRKLEIKIIIMLLCTAMLLPTISFADDNEKTNGKYISIHTGSREQENYDFSDPLESDKYLLLLAEIYTPDKLQEWENVIAEKNEFKTEMKVTWFENEKYKERKIISDVIFDVIREKEEKGELSNEEADKEYDILFRFSDGYSFNDEENFDEYELMEAFDLEDSKAVIDNLNKGLNMYKIENSEHSLIRKKFNDILTNPYYSKDNKYFDEKKYNEQVQHYTRLRNTKKIYDEDLLNIVQLHTPEKIEEWKKVIEDHRKRSNQVIKKELNRNKEIQEKLLVIRNSSKEGKMQSEDFIKELRNLVKSTYIYNWYKDQMEEARKIPGEFQSVVGPIKVWVEQKAEFDKTWDKYIEVVLKAEKALESNCEDDIKELLNELLKQRQELQKNDYFINYTIQ
ncbi:hypothetical protein [Brassicibacter mesophilus]|uniref:hypothetical protein n=1 Tax=Brassicibacter mesophilus TaxID=745119 RepID=UPI003D1A0EB0